MSNSLIHKDRAPWNALARRLLAIRSGIEQDVRRPRHWPDERVLLAYTEGRLGRIRRWLVERHLNRCRECAGLLADYAKDQREIDEIGVIR